MTTPTTDTAAPRFPGQPFTLGGRDLIVPPLSLAQMRALAPKLDGIGARVTLEQLAILGDVIHAALSRNYPDIDRAWLDEVLDLGNVTALTGATMIGLPS